MEEYLPHGSRRYGNGLRGCTRCENRFSDSDLTKVSILVASKKINKETKEIEKKYVTPTFSYYLCQRCYNLSYLNDDASKDSHEKWWYNCFKVMFAFHKMYDESPNIKVQRPKNQRAEENKPGNLI